jgi:hypothetical protein
MWRSAVQLCLGLHRRVCAALGGLAQLARAPALQAGGQRFESVILHTRQSGPKGTHTSPQESIEKAEAIFDMLDTKTSKVVNETFSYNVQLKVYLSASSARR